MIVEEAITSDRLEAVERVYSLRRPDEVRRFLARHSFLAPLLVTAQEKIEGYFAQLELGLEVVTDPEGIDDQQLVLFVVVSTTPVEAFATLQRFDNDWWLDAIDDARGTLCISLEFR